MSSYAQPQEYISVDEFRATMRLVRLQVAIPISVLVALGTNLVCALVLKPGTAQISNLYPTLLTPNNHIVGIYAAVFFAFEIGLCLLLTVAHAEETKNALVHGVGVRLAVANWLLAAWAACWILQWFRGAAVLVAVNVLIVLSIHITLRAYRPTFAHPLTAALVHTPISLLLPLLLAGLLHNGSVALGWVIDKHAKWDRWVWPAVGGIAGVHGVCAVWECLGLQYTLAAGNEALLVALLLSAPRVDPSLPDSARPKPPQLVMATIGALVLHPLALALGVAWASHRNRTGRIRLEEEVVEDERRIAAAEAQAERRGARGEVEGEAV